MYIKKYKHGQAIANKLNIMRVCIGEKHGQTIANSFNIMRVWIGEKLGQTNS